MGRKDLLHRNWGDSLRFIYWKVPWTQNLYKGNLSMAVLRYKENFVGVSNWAYELLEIEDHPNLTHESPKGKVVHHEPKRLSKDEAKAIIKEHGLVIAMRLDTGETIWDTPDKAYQERWQGTKIDSEFVI